MQYQQAAAAAVAAAVAAAAAAATRVVQQCPHGPRAYHLGLQMGQRLSVVAWETTHGE